MKHYLMKLMIMTYGIAAESNRRKYRMWNSHGNSRHGTIGSSVFWCMVRM